MTVTRIKATIGVGQGDQPALLIQPDEGEPYIYFDGGIYEFPLPKRKIARFEKDLDIARKCGLVKDISDYKTAKIFADLEEAGRKADEEFIRLPTDGWTWIAWERMSGKKSEYSRK